MPAETLRQRQATDIPLKRRANTIPRMTTELDWIETDWYLAALVAMSTPSPSPETSDATMNRVRESSGSERTGRMARQQAIEPAPPVTRHRPEHPGCGSSPGSTRHHIKERSSSRRTS